MNSNVDVTTIPPGQNMSSLTMLGSIGFALAAFLLWMTVELADPDFEGYRKAGWLELLPVWLRVPLFLMAAVSVALKARSFFKITQAGWSLVLSPIGLTMPGGFGWRTFDWSEFSSVIIGGSKSDSIYLHFARQDLLAKLKRRRFSDLELQQTNYGLPTSEILAIIERYRSQRRSTER